MNYFDLIQHYFIQTTGRGVVLGSEDARFLRRCEAQGIAPNEVCIGIRRAIESRRELPRNIMNCAPWISTPRRDLKAKSNEIGERHSYFTHKMREERQEMSASERYRKSIVVAMQRIEEAGKTSDESFKEAYREAYRQTRALLTSHEREKERPTGENTNEISLLQQIEEELAASIWLLLDPEQQEEILNAVEALIQPYSSEEAKRNFRIYRRRYELFTRYKIPRLY